METTTAPLALIDISRLYDARAVADVPFLPPGQTLEVDAGGSLILPTGAISDAPGAP